MVIAGHPLEQQVVVNNCFPVVPGGSLSQWYLGEACPSGT